MCGINGYTAARGERVQRTTLLAMNAAAHHRGPDEGGTADLGFAGLAQRRLSIVDLAHGRQPLVSIDGKRTLVYNGELYDYAPLRDELRRGGCEFGTRTDTEVLLNALQRWDVDAFSRLNGMYAFALADARDQSLLLARDPLGIKPLYYWHGPDGELVFSSELTGLLEHPSVPRRLDRRSLLMLLVDRYVAEPWTLFEGVRALPPGHWLRWRAGKIELHDFRAALPQPEVRDEEQALGELRGLLDRCVRSQMEADVPVGVFLSGGIDSSTVAAYARRAQRELGRGELHAFSIGFSRSGYDETGLARSVARHLGLVHHVRRIEDARFEAADLARIVQHVGQPLGDTSCIPTYAVSRLAREHVKVVLSGDGGDELFGGYDHMFWAATVRRFAARSPRLLRRAGARLLDEAAPLFPRALARHARRARKGLEVSLYEPLEQQRRMRALWSTEEARALLVGGLDLELRPELRAADQPSLALPPEQYAARLLLSTYLPGAILAKVDRMSMAASLEVRVPLLDERMLDFAARLPLDLQVRDGVGKYLLRRAGAHLLPDEVYSHRKQGFAIPLFEWFNASFHELLNDYYAPGTLGASLFEPRELADTLQRARAAQDDPARLSDHAAATRAWVLAQLGCWLERFEVST
jgi:asparagine synthase (glutamine-hydrolysing)